MSSFSAKPPGRGLGEGVLHHSFLEARGGAARVANLLHAGMLGQGEKSSRSFEVVQSEEGQLALDAVGGRWFAMLEQGIREGRLLHLHSSSDWLALLQRLAPLSPRCAITMHDMSLATGGCVSPLGCSHFQNDCHDPCPRDLPHTAQRRQRLREVLWALQPVCMCPSAWGRDVIQQSIPWLNVRLAPNGVPWPDSIADKSIAKKEVGLVPTARLALFVAHGGEAAGVKAGSRWQAIWRRIKVLVPNAVGFLVGGAEQARDGDLIRWPYLDPAKLNKLFAAADCLVYPSLADNHPLTILEAFAHGCPVVAWEVGGIPEMITDGATGILRPVGDEAGLAKAAAMLLKRPSVGKQMAKTAYARGQKHFSVERMVRDVLTILTESRDA